MDTEDEEEELEEEPQAEPRQKLKFNYDPKRVFDFEEEEDFEEVQQKTLTSQGTSNDNGKRKWDKL